MRRVSDQRGMTLVELLAAMSVTMIVSLASFALIDLVMQKTGQVGGRVAATQQGRQAMDTVTREVRSQVCVRRSDDAAMLTPRSIYAATPTSLTFFASLGDDSYHGSNTPPAPELQQLAFVNGQLVERDYAGTLTSASGATSQTFSYPGWPNSPTSTKLLLDKVTNYDAIGSNPVYFRYFAFRTTAPLTPTSPLSPGGTLTDAELPLVAKISVAYKTLPPAGSGTTPGTVVFDNDIFVRTADPNSPTPRPVCA